MSKQSAEFIKKLDDSGETCLYRVSPPVEYQQHDANGALVKTTDYVMVRATGPSVYIFPSDKNGNVLEWVELAGSQRIY